MDFWIPLLGGALGAAVINGVLALYKLRHDVGLEHNQWSRNQRQATYIAFLSAVSDARTALEVVQSDKSTGRQVSDSDSAATLEAMAAVQKQRPEIFLVAPSSVGGTAMEVNNTLNGMVDALETPEDTEQWKTALRKHEGAVLGFVSIAKADLGVFTIDEKREETLSIIRRLHREADRKRDLGI